MLELYCKKYPELHWVQFEIKFPKHCEQPVGHKIEHASI
jgi:hypothetical protein